MKKFDIRFKTQLKTNDGKQSATNRVKDAVEIPFHAGLRIGRFVKMDGSIIVVY